MNSDHLHTWLTRKPSKNRTLDLGHFQDYAFNDSKLHSRNSPAEPKILAIANYSLLNYGRYNHQRISSKTTKSFTHQQRKSSSLLLNRILPTLSPSHRTTRSPLHKRPVNTRLVYSEMFSLLWIKLSYFGSSPEMTSYQRIALEEHILWYKDIYSGCQNCPTGFIFKLVRSN